MVTRARKSSEASAERKKTRSRGEAWEEASPVSLSAILLSPVLPSLNSTDWRETARGLGMIEWGQKSKPLIHYVRFSSLNNHSLLGDTYLSSPYEEVHSSPLISGENKILEQPSFINVTVMH